MRAAGTAVPRSEMPGPALGMVLFISSEVMFFAALFGAYFTIRARASEWPPAGVEIETLLPAFATAVLIGSSATMHRADNRAAAADPRGVGRWLLVTLGLGALFLLAQAYEYSQLEFGASDHSFGTLFYTLTGFHALHVFAGLVALGLAWLKNARAVGAPHATVLATGIYWHFVDVVWVVLFATLYVLR
jgi:cytochrome c oxidase subunit III